MLELKGIKKDYIVGKAAFPALKGIDLYFPKQQLCSILGPSGCGKTTLLNIIGGLDQYTSGDILIEGQSTKNFTDKEWDNYRNKRIGFVFQSYNLIPQLSLLDNVTMGLTIEGVKRKEKVKRGKEALDKVGLKGLYNKKPNQLSGGQMQRVAIARAIIHNPEIILADEPTGALDSKTSEQVMQILKEISKDRLVIMVTHNRDLARRYSNRVIEFKDGLVEQDYKKEEMALLKKKEDALYKAQHQVQLKDFDIIDEKHKKKNKKKNKPKKLSSMGFFTALKISFNNLLVKKGRTIMTAVAGSFGIIGVALVLSVNNGFGMYMDNLEASTASQWPLNISAYSVTYEKDPNYVENPKYTEDKNVFPYKTENMKESFNYNNITKKYIDYLDYLKDEEDLVNDYVVSFGDTYNMNLVTENPVTKEPYLVENGSVIMMSDMITSFTGLPTTFFHVLYGEEEFITETYEVIEGDYPDANNIGDMVLVVDARNQIPLPVLKRLGFYEDNDSITLKYAEEHPVSFDDILNKTYKVYPNDEFYDISTKSVPNSKENVYYYEDKDINEVYNDKDLGIDLRITGILRPKETSQFASMTTGLCYQNSLLNYLVEENTKDLVSINYEHNMTWKEGKSVNDFLNELSTMAKPDDSSYDEDQVSAKLNFIFDKYLDFYNVYGGEKVAKDGTSYKVSDYFKWAKTIGVDLVPSDLKRDGVEGIKSYIDKISNYLISSLDGQLKENLYKSYPFIIGFLAYTNSYSNIENVIIFPTSLTGKSKLMKRLDDYNTIVKDDPHHASDKSEQIFYTDVVGSFTDNMTQLIDIISMVLIVFASISLVVSCVMTGIITYVSVIERTKEIGILRALGARKKDVGRLFEAECVIIGLLSGGVGCLIAYVFTFPINAIINMLYPGYGIGNIASLAWTSILTLIAISVVLTFISSLLPSRAAARKDPVIALRSE